MAHWHDFNPWAEKLIYLPDLEELAAAIAPTTKQEETLAYWRRAGKKIDAYLLPQPSGDVSVGIRYGADGAEYISIYHNNHAALWELIRKYQPDHPALEARSA